MPPCIGGPLGGHQQMIPAPFSDVQAVGMSLDQTGCFQGYAKPSLAVPGVVTRGKAMSNHIQVTRPPSQRCSVGGKGKNVLNGKVAKPAVAAAKKGFSIGKDQAHRLAGVGKRMPSGKGKGSAPEPAPKQPPQSRSRGKNMANLRRSAAASAAVAPEPRRMSVDIPDVPELRNHLLAHHLHPGHRQPCFPAEYHQPMMPPPQPPASLGSLHDHCRMKAREALGLDQAPHWPPQQYFLRSRANAVMQPLHYQSVNPSKGIGGPPVVRSRSSHASCPLDRALTIDCSVEYDMPAHIAHDLASGRRDPLLIIHPEWQRRVTRSARAQPWWLQPQQPRVPVSFSVPVDYRGHPPCSQCPPFAPPPPQAYAMESSNRKRPYNHLLMAPEPVATPLVYSTAAATATKTRNTFTTTTSLMACGKRFLLSLFSAVFMVLTSVLLSLSVQQLCKEAEHN